MICPVCSFGNFPGDDACANCGADLWAADVPEAATGFHGRLLGTHLDELEAPEPRLVGVATPIDEALRLMHDEAVDCLLVMDGDRLVGVFTDRDAVLNVAGRATRPAVVAEVMTRDPVILRHDDPIAVAIHKMAVGGFRHVPIVEDGRPTGIVSARDVFRHISVRLS